MVKTVACVQLPDLRSKNQREGICVLQSIIMPKAVWFFSEYAENDLIGSLII